MTITLKLFAAYREAFGQDVCIWSITPGATVASVLAEVIAQHPELARWAAVTRFAVNQEFVLATKLLQAGDELVFIPPVSGG